MLVDSDHRSWVSERNLMTTHFLLETWRSLRESNSAMHGFKIQRTKITRGLATSRKQNGALGACTWAAPKAKETIRKTWTALSWKTEIIWRQFWLEIRPPVAHFPGIWFPDPGIMNSSGSLWFQSRTISKCLKVVNLDYFVAKKQSNLIEFWLEIRFPVTHFGP